MSVWVHIKILWGVSPDGGMVNNDSLADIPPPPPAAEKQPNAKPSDNNTTFHISGKGLECHKVAEMFRTMGLACYVVQNMTVRYDKDYNCHTETGCKIKIHKFPDDRGRHSLHTVWTAMKKEFGLGCAHVRVRSTDSKNIADGCVLNVVNGTSTKK